MPSCALPLLSRLMLPTMSGGLVCALMAAFIGHSVLRTFLEARGVVPWGLRDSVGALPMMIMGAALVGVSCTLITGAVVAICPIEDGTSVLASLSIACLLTGVVLLRLGLIEVRKLT